MKKLILLLFLCVLAIQTTSAQNEQDSTEKTSYDDGIESQWIFGLGINLTKNSM